MTLVVYDGPTSKDDLSGGFHVRDEDRTMYQLEFGRVVDVPDPLGKELLKPAKERDKRFAGHKFRQPSKDEREAFEKFTGSSADEDPDAGGPGGSGAASGGGTGAASART